MNYTKKTKTLSTPMLLFASLLLLAPTSQAQTAEEMLLASLLGSNANRAPATSSTDATATSAATAASTANHSPASKNDPDNTSTSVQGSNQSASSQLINSPSVNNPSVNKQPVDNQPASNDSISSRAITGQEHTAQRSVQATGQTTANVTAIPATNSDAEILERLTAVFAEIEDLKNIVISVSQGEVMLSGDVANEKVAAQAVRMASRFSGVRGVTDKITRTLAIEDNVTTVLKSVRQKGIEFARALPLIGIGILVFLLINALGKFIASRHALWERISPNPFVAELIGQSLRVVFMLIGIIIGLSFIGAEKLLSTVLGGAGVIGIAVGFAVKDSIENYIASVMLSIRQPFRANDHVVINGSKEGIVMRLTSRATILMTLDGNQLRVPNAEVFKGVILNYTSNPERRFSFDLFIDASQDPVAAMKVGLEAIRAHDFILTKPKSSATISDITESYIKLGFRAWVNQSDTDFGKARSLAIKSAKKALADNGFGLSDGVTQVMLMTQTPQTLQTAKADPSSPVDEDQLARPESMLESIPSSVSLSKDTAPTTTATTAADDMVNTTASTGRPAGNAPVTTSTDSETNTNAHPSALSDDDALCATPNHDLIASVTRPASARPEKNLLDDTSPRE